MFRGESACLELTFCSICLSQIRDVHPTDEPDLHPTLVSVGLLLAPDEFQMVLDADNCESTHFSYTHFLLPHLYCFLKDVCHQTCNFQYIQTVRYCFSFIEITFG